ncbi:NUDIX domain-containing protein [Weissella paramesenteroides]|uniref:NUDIX domain-containing protein n=1 Tax=Weissella paramesenteroides TaxID=1249 RepID=UPI0013DB00D1|nr:NUDIX domain-containing protein [Weissella paramesenteroides]NEZ89062.1 NUDIX domain-containing protein [Weissella paramesenteroides]NFB03387.1 NUDIX domain-containing protein [Weissella paramesenteroides]
MKRTQQIELTNMCIIKDGNDILVMDKTDSEFENSITFPGGHVEQNESIQASVIREIKEETGIDIVEPQLKGIVNFNLDNQIKEFIFVYEAECNSNVSKATIKQTYEGKTYWINKAQIKSLQLNKVIEAVYDTWLKGEVKELYFEN